LDWQTDREADNHVRLELYSEAVSGETLKGLTPSWNLPSHIRQVFYGRPLMKIWDQDGSAGEDGNVGPQSSGVTLDIDNVSIDAGTDVSQGTPLLLVFDGDMRGAELNLSFQAPGALCSTVGSVREGVLFNSFDSGTLTEWTTHEGAWSVVTGLLYQDMGNVDAIAESYLSYAADFTYSARMLVSLKDRAGLVFRMVDSQNYYFAGLDVDDNQIYIERVSGGVGTVVATTSAPLDKNIWYTVAIRVVGTEIKVYLDCEMVLAHIEPDIWLTGTLGLRTVITRAYFDDARARLVPPEET
jgi:hypothetical protein